MSVHREVTEIPEGRVHRQRPADQRRAEPGRIPGVFQPGILLLLRCGRARSSTKDSIDFTQAYYKSRYDKGEADYINCPMDKAQFEAFYDA